MRRVAKTVGCVICAVSAALTAVSSAWAESSLQFDVNQANAQAWTGHDGGGFKGGFHTGYDGSVVALADSNTAFDGLFLNGVFEELGAGFSLSSFNVVLNFTDGNVVGGSYEISVTNGLVTDTFTASLYDNNGAAENIAVDLNGQFSIVAGASAGEFSGATFGGIDVTEFDAPLFGTLIELFYRPNFNGLDENTDVDLLIVIPAPPAVLWGIGGLAAMIIGRNRYLRIRT